ncbi:hypothetical protein S40293_11182 [Stachybotrys chartarum IBT 40293]|nr:hypothetical protein S40293_11182 [Stachybotrys chartarum IBT 40293]
MPSFRTPSFQLADKEESQKQMHFAIVPPSHNRKHILDSPSIRPSGDDEAPSLSPLGGESASSEWCWEGLHPTNRSTGRIPISSIAGVAMGGRPGSLHLAKGGSMGKHARQSRSSKNDVTARMEWLHRVRSRGLAYELC